MTSSAIRMDDLDPNNLPQIPTALDMWILRDQNLVLTVNWDKNDEIINMDFQGFEQQIQNTFSQTLSPQSRPYNQGLILKFVSMNE